MKTVFITGGSTGIGAASVKKFIQQGWNVGFMDINEKAAHERMEEINRPDQLIFVPGNTRNREDIRNAVEETVKRFGQLDSVWQMRASTVATPCWTSRTKSLTS